MTTLPTVRLVRLRWAVRLVLLLGVTASVAGNILHARDNPISQAIAAWPPLALLLAVELISRVPVHRYALATVRWLATAVIASIAAWVSYWHMVGVAAAYGESGASPYLLPLSVDGLIVVASICLVELGGRIRADSVPAPVRRTLPIVPLLTPPAADAKPRVRRPRSLTSAAKVAAAAAKLPTGTPAQIAAKAGVSESTARRYLPSPTGQRPAETVVNGATV